MATKRKPFPSAKIIPLKSARGTSVIDAVLTKRGPGRPAGTQRRTLGDKLKAVLGRKTMNAKQAAEAILATGEHFDSNNVPNIMAAALAQSTVRVKGADGEPLRDRHGVLVKVHVFTAVERGLYRVSTPEDIEREASEILGKPVAAARNPPSKSRAPKTPVKTPVVSNGSADTDITEMLRDTIRGELKTMLGGSSLDLKAHVQSELKSILQSELRDMVRQLLSDRKS